MCLTHSWPQQPQLRFTVPRGQWITFITDKTLAFSIGMGFTFSLHFIFIWEWKTRRRKFGMRSPFSILIPILSVKKWIGDLQQSMMQNESSPELTLIFPIRRVEKSLILDECFEAMLRFIVAIKEDVISRKVFVLWDPFCQIFSECNKSFQLEIHSVFCVLTNTMAVLSHDCKVVLIHTGVVSTLIHIWFCICEKGTDVQGTKDYGLSPQYSKKVSRRKPFNFPHCTFQSASPNKGQLSNHRNGKTSETPVPVYKQAICSLLNHTLLKNLSKK